MAESGPESFWESVEAVERFAGRELDVRLGRLMELYPDPASVRVLDVGCAAGRNTVPLAERGFDVFAVDSSVAMVTRTRERVARVLGEEAAERRVLPGSMDDLSSFGDRTVRLVVALGVLHQAGSRRQWSRAIDEMARVMAPEGLLLLAAWSPRSRPDGRALQRVPGGDDLYEGFHSGTHYLVAPQVLDEALAAAGLVPVQATEEVEVHTDRGTRVTINGLYTKRDD